MRSCTTERDLSQSCSETMLGSEIACADLTPNSVTWHLRIRFSPTPLAPALERVPKSCLLLQRCDSFHWTVYSVFTHVTACTLFVSFARRVRVASEKRGEGGSSFRKNIHAFSLHCIITLLELLNALRWMQINRGCHFNKLIATQITEA